MSDTRDIGLGRVNWGSRGTASNGAVQGASVWLSAAPGDPPLTPACFACARHAVRAHRDLHSWPGVL